MFPVSSTVPHNWNCHSAECAPFPDIPEHADAPSPVRLSYDKIATNSDFKLNPECLAEYFISGPGGIDPDIEIDDDIYADCYQRLSEILEDAYTQSETFRRLMNHAYDKELYDIEQRWLLGAGEAFGATITPEQLSVSEGRKVICLNLDEDNDGDNPEYYESSDGPKPFDTERSFIHEIVHALTHLEDKEDNHPRGPVVEYTNIILRELGNQSAPRIIY